MLRLVSGSEAARRSVAGVGVPLLCEVLPEVSGVLAGTLAGLGEPELAARSSGSLMLWLAVDGHIAGEVSLDPDGRFVTDFEISDCAALGIRPDWYDAARDTGEIV